MDKKIYWFLSLTLIPIFLYALAGKDLIYFRSFFFALFGLILGKRWGSLAGAVFVVGVFALDRIWFLNELSLGGISLFLLTGIIISFWVGAYKDLPRVPLSLSLAIVVFFIFVGYLIYLESLNWPIYFLYPFLIAASALIYYFFRLIKERTLIQIFLSGLILSYLLAWGINLLIQGKTAFASYNTLVLISLIPGDILTLATLAIIYPHFLLLLRKKMAPDREKNN